MSPRSRPLCVRNSRLEPRRFRPAVEACEDRTTAGQTMGVFGWVFLGPSFALLDQSLWPFLGEPDDTLAQLAILSESESSAAATFPATSLEHSALTIPPPTFAQSARDEQTAPRYVDGGQLFAADPELNAELDGFAAGSASLLEALRSDLQPQNRGRVPQFETAFGPSSFTASGALSGLLPGGGFAGGAGESAPGAGGPGGPGLGGGGGTWNGGGGGSFGPNAPPVANADSYAIAHDRQLIVSAPGVLQNDEDPDGDPITAVLVAGPAPGTGTLNQFNSDGSFTYTPPSSWTGTAVITYKAYDGQAYSPDATVTISVFNVPPVPEHDNFTVMKNQSLVVGAPSLKGNDWDNDGDSLTTIKVTDPDAGTGTITQFGTDGSFTYAPPTDWTGLATFTYKVNDGIQDSDPTTVAIHVTHDTVVSITPIDGTGAETGSNDITLRFTRTGSTSADLPVFFGTSGTALEGDDYEPTGGVVTILAGQTSVDLIVKPLDDAGFEGSESIQVDLIPQPDSYFVGAGSVAATLNDDGTDLPVVTIAATDHGGTEVPGNTAQFTVYTSKTLAADLVVSYSVGGTATAGSDYQALSGTVTIPAGQPSAPIAVTPQDDSAAEGAENVVVTLTANAAYVVGAEGSAEVGIYDNEIEVSLVANVNTTKEGGPTWGEFTLTRVGDLSGELPVMYFAFGTASVNDDFAPLPEVKFEPGQSTLILPVIAFYDELEEADETIQVTVVPDMGYVVGAANAGQVVIQNFSPPLPQPRTIAVDAVPSPAYAYEAGQEPGIFRLYRKDENYTPAVTVTYTLTGTASYPADYSITPPPVYTAVIPGGVKDVLVIVTPVDDAIVETQESVILTITNVTAPYTIDPDNTDTVWIVDNDIGGTPGDFALGGTVRTQSPFT